ncbi:MAG: lysylphosphatidylglycerol synthase transmembrane domain-containing protein [Candidatus Cloacimonadaceae bacterium]|jgi:uncharacterized membrane protein YbhN (UPF0104 family)|nr:flippase-like domain-containing protein [Candidatus Cloacimonadota bacterium]MCB5258319.1 flippase-like domain-containing protein [Candidatus Cloacimonadota bacterium]MDD5625075.1 lysylphosphatidylglycerol synthase transmembrane domain-containing protein [Candidatus Cloacimonadota bacterium]
MQTEKNKSNLRGVISFILKLGITILIMWSIFSKLDLKEVGREFVTQPVWVILVLIGLTVLRHWGQYLTWKWALMINPNYHPAKYEIFNSYMIGQALRFAIPGSFGMIGKIAFIHNDSRINSLYSFILERIFVIWALLFFTGLALVFVDIGLPSWISWLLFLIFITMPFWTYFLLSVDRRLKKLQPGYLKLAPAMVVAQIVITLLNYVQYWILLDQVQSVSFWEIMNRMSLSHLAYGIPITFAGLGIKEKLAIPLLSDIGYMSEHIVSTTLIIFIIQDVAAALIGAAIFLKVKRTK